MRAICLFTLAILLSATVRPAEEKDTTVLVFEEFEGDSLDTKQWPNVELVKSPTFNKSKGAAAASPMPGNKYFGMGFSCDLRLRPKTENGTVLYFVYHCDSMKNFKIQINTDSKNGNIVYHFRSVPGIWVPMYLPFSSLRFDNGVSAEAVGETLKSVNIYGGAPDEQFAFHVDDFCVFYVKPPEKLAPIIEREQAAEKALSATLAKERYTMNKSIVYLIRGVGANAEKPPRPQTVMIAGSTAAKDSAFIRKLGFRELKSYRFTSASHTTGKGKDMAWIKDQLERYLPDDRPETVVLMPGVEDVLAGAGNNDVRERVGKLVDLCHKHGAAVVLCTPPERLDIKTPLASAAQTMSTALFMYADLNLVPLLDACAIANADPRDNFNKLTVSSRGYKAVNAVAAELFTALEQWAFDRGEAGDKGTEETPSGTPAKDEPKRKDIDDIKI